MQSTRWAISLWPRTDQSVTTLIQQLCDITSFWPVSPVPIQCAVQASSLWSKSNAKLRVLLNNKLTTPCVLHLGRRVQSNLVSSERTRKLVGRWLKQGKPSPPCNEFPTDQNILQISSTQPPTWNKTKKNHFFPIIPLVSWAYIISIIMVSR